MFIMVLVMQWHEVGMLQWFLSISKPSLEPQEQLGLLQQLECSLLGCTTGTGWFEHLV